MSIPVLASNAAPAKAQPAGGSGGPTATSGSAPAGVFAAVLQSSLGLNETSTPGKTGGDRDDTVHATVHTVDGMDQIVVPALFTAAAPPPGLSVASLTDADGVGLPDAGVASLTGADTTGSGSAGSASTGAGDAMTTPGSQAAPFEVAGATPVAALSTADPLATSAASVPASTTGATGAGLAVTTGDGSMTRAGARPGGLPASTTGRARAGAAAATAIATAATATAASASAASATSPTAPLAAGSNQVTAAQVTAAPEIIAPVTAAAAQESTPPTATPASRIAANAAPGATPVDRFAAALSAHAPFSTAAVAGESPGTIQPALLPGMVPVHQAAPAVPAAPAASVGATSTSTQPVPLTAQVAAPLFTLVGAKPGEHVLTINVSPDNLGPVVVRAHVSADSVRVELFAPNDAGRDALRAILPDLRRDLAGSGLNANLDLSSQNQASDSESAGRDASRERRALEGDSVAEQPTGTARPRGFGSSSTIDVLA